MGEAAVSISVRFITLTCCASGCGIVFAVPDWFEKSRREDREFWYCPSGHRQHFTGKTEVEKLREQLAAEQRRTEAAKEDADWQKRSREAETRRHSATKGLLTKTKKRINAGVCPCCRRNFVSLGEHMRKMHPGFVTGDPA